MSQPDKWDKKKPTLLSLLTDWCSSFVSSSDTFFGEKTETISYRDHREEYLTKKDRSAYLRHNSYPSFKVTGLTLCRPIIPQRMSTKDPWVWELGGEETTTTICRPITRPRSRSCQVTTRGIWRIRWRGIVRRMCIKGRSRRTWKWRNRSWKVSSRYFAISKGLKGQLLILTRASTQRVSKKTQRSLSWGRCWAGSRRDTRSNSRNLRRRTNKCRHFRYVISLLITGVHSHSPCICRKWDRNGESR